MVGFSLYCVIRPAWYSIIPTVEFRISSWRGNGQNGLVGPMRRDEGIEAKVSQRVAVDDDECALR